MPTSSPNSVELLLDVSGDDAPRRVEAVAIPALTRVRDLTGRPARLTLQAGTVAR